MDQLFNKTCLVATQTLCFDLHFSDVVVYLYEQNENYVKGVVINKPIDDELLESGLKKDIEMQYLLQKKQQLNIESIIAGGPVCVESLFAVKGGGSQVKVEPVYDIKNFDYAGVKELAFGNIVWSKAKLHEEYKSGFWEVLFSAYDLLDAEYDLRRGDAYGYLGVDDGILYPGIYRV